MADKQGIASAGSVAVALFVDAAAERILKLAGFVDQLVELFPVPVIDHVVTHPGGKHVGVAEGSLDQGYEIGGDGHRTGAIGVADERQES